MPTPVKEQLMEQLDALPGPLQHRVLEFARALALSQPRGIPGSELLRFDGTISADDLEQMQKAIEAGCEQVDDEW